MTAKDTLLHGVGFMQDGKRIDPSDVYLRPNEIVKGTHMDKAAREKARELCERLPVGPWTVLNYVEAAPYPNYHQAIAVSKVVHENLSTVDEHMVRELSIAARTILPQALDALDAADSDNARLQARVDELEAALRFYVSAWKFKPNKQYGGLEWSPTEELLDDCGNRARAAIPAPPVGDR